MMSITAVRHGALALGLCALLAALSCAKKEEDLSWRRPLDDMGRAFVAADPERFLGAFLPAYADSIRADYGKEAMERGRQEMIDRIGGGLEVSLTVLASQDLDRATLDGLEAAYAEGFPGAPAFTAGRLLAVEYSFKGDKDFEKDAKEYSIVKADGVWYLTEL